MNVAAGILPAAGLDVLPSVLLVALLYTLVAGLVVVRRYVVLRQVFGFPVAYRSVELRPASDFLV